MAWDEDSLTVSFALGGTERQRIYIENSYSVSFKLELVQAYGLGGLAVSDGSAQSDVANIWPTVRSLVDSGTVTLMRPNDIMLQVSWQSPDASIVTEPGATNATWTPHASGEQHVELVVSDGEHRFGQRSRSTSVKAALRPRLRRCRRSRPRKRRRLSRRDVVPDPGRGGSA